MPALRRCSNLSHLVPPGAQLSGVRAGAGARGARLLAGGLFLQFDGGGGRLQRLVRGFPRLHLAQSAMAAFPGEQHRAHADCAVCLLPVLQDTLPGLRSAGAPSVRRGFRGASRGGTQPPAQTGVSGHFALFVLKARSLASILSMTFSRATSLESSANSGSDAAGTPIRSAIPVTSVMSLVTSCSASRLIWRSRSARLSAMAAMRF